MTIYEKVKPAYGYHNFITGKTDYLTESPSDWAPYIPQITAAQAMYQIGIEMGESPAMSAKRVLEACCGKHE